MPRNNTIQSNYFNNKTSFATHPLSSSSKDKVQNNQTSDANIVKPKPTLNIQTIAKQLQNLLSNITKDETDVKDALIAIIIAILTLILNLNDNTCVLYWNSRGVTQKYLELLSLTQNKKIDILSINETYLTNASNIYLTNEVNLFF